MVKAVNDEWYKRTKASNQEQLNIDTKIAELKMQARMAIEKIKYLTSETAIKYMESEVVKAEQQLSKLMEEKEKTVGPYDMKLVMAYIKYFLEHMEELLLSGSDPLLQASYFGVLFDKAPTYQEIFSGTPQLAQCIKLNEAYRRHKGKLAAGLGFEPR